MLSRIKLILALFLVLSVVMNPITYVQAQTESEKEKDLYDIEMDFLIQIQEFLKNNFVDEIGDIDLIRGAIKGMVESLNDPYSKYYYPEEFQAFQDTTMGNFGGIGVNITSYKNAIIVLSVIEGRPAEKAGIRSGDIIVEVDGINVTGYSLPEVSELIKGPEGTKVTIGILRGENSSIQRFEIIRDVIELNPVEWKLVDENIGYLKITYFNNNTVENVDKVLDIFKMTGIRAIILDLRNNPGGLMDQSIEVAKRFVPEGPIVNIVKGDGTILTYKSDTKTIPYELVVLINNNSASAAEILAGAVKDRGAGILVGEKTFGKATVQLTRNLGMFGGIKLTIARYTTPNGTDINKSGIIPDIEVKNEDYSYIPDFEPIKGDRKLQYGCIGLDVLGLQQRLGFLDLFEATPDGVFGPRTQEAVKRFQEQKGLDVTGVVDKEFLTLLDDAVYDAVISREDIQLNKALEIINERLMKKQQNAA